MSYENQSTEIDLIELFETIWDGRMLVAGASALALSLGTAYVLLSPDSFKASLNLRPLSTTSMLEYTELNQIDFFNISPARLMQQMTDILLEREVFISEFEQLGVFDRADFDTDAKYELEVRKAAFEISIEPDTLDEYASEDPVNARNNQGWTLSFEGDDLDAMTILVDNALSNAQELTRQRLIEAFNYQADATMQSQLFTIEDTNLQIENAYEDYEANISARIEFLREQAQIARTLDLARNTLEVANFAQGSVLANVNSRTPFYMRGYEAIEKEIDILQSRTNIEARIREMPELRSTIRSIRQDRTLDRSVAAFRASPINYPERFSAINYNLAALDVTHQKRTALILTLSVILGGLLGATTVLIRGAKRSKNKHQSY